MKPLILWLCTEILDYDLWPLAVYLFFLPPVLYQELSDEALGQLTCVPEELLVEVIVHRRDVPQRLLLGVAEER